MIVLECISGNVVVDANVENTTSKSPESTVVPSISIFGCVNGDNPTQPLAESNMSYDGIF